MDFGPSGSLRRIQALTGKCRRFPHGVLGSWSRRQLSCQDLTQQDSKSKLLDYLAVRHSGALTTIDSRIGELLNSVRRPSRANLLLTFYGRGVGSLVAVRVPISASAYYIA